MNAFYRKLLSVTALFLPFLPGQGQVSQQDSIKFTHQLIRIEQQLADDIAPGITANWNKYLHPAFFVITEDGTQYDKSSYLAAFGPLPKGYIGRIKVIKPKTVFHSNMAVISYVADEYLDVYDNHIHTTYATMNTYIRQDTSWQMVSSQVYEIPAIPPAIQVPATILSNYAGTYQLTDSITCVVSVGNDSLYIQKKGRPREVLLAETNNVFFRKTDGRGRKIFLQNEKGIMFMRERRNGQDISWKRIYK